MNNKVIAHKCAIFSLNPWHVRYVQSWMEKYGIKVKSLDTNAPELKGVYDRILYSYERKDEIWDIQDLLKFYKGEENGKDNNVGNGKWSYTIRMSPSYN